MNDRQAITNQHRAARLESTSGSAGRLAEVERAALGWRQKVIDEKEKLSDSGDYSSQYVGKHIAQLGTQWLEEKTQLEEIIEKVEQAIDRVPDALPERTEYHRELSAEFKTLKGDARHEAITAAIMGRDKNLAEALATEPPFTSTLIEQDRQMIIKNLQPEAHAKDQARVADLQSRVAAARATLREVTITISGAS